MFARLAPVFALCLIAAVACKKQEAKTEPAPSGGTEQPATTGDAGGTMANAGAKCGGMPAVACADAAEYCHLGEGVCATTADAEGVCMKKPEACPEMSAPVCGCDGTTYDNACKASMAGVSVKAQGACAAPQ